MSASWIALGLAASLGFTLLFAAIISFGDVDCCPHSDLDGDVEEFEEAS